MGAKYTQIRETAMALFGEAMDEKSDDLMRTIDMMDEKGKTASLSIKFLPSEDPDICNIKMNFKFVPERVEVKVEGFTERVKAQLKKVRTAGEE
jgi:hypothetical protein